MKCDLCNRRSRRVLCGPCADMIQRLLAVDARMHSKELCIGQKMDLRAREAEAKKRAEIAGTVTLSIQPETK